MPKTRRQNRTPEIVGFGMSSDAYHIDVTAGTMARAPRWLKIVTASCWATAAGMVVLEEYEHAKNAAPKSYA
ncbi:hypothetical protein CQA89_32175, partial [Klebsiella pneumoniae]